jgi:hypothetical protein
MFSCSPRKFASRPGIRDGGIDKGRAASTLAMRQCRPPHRGPRAPPSDRQASIISLLVRASHADTTARRFVGRRNSCELPAGGPRVRLCAPSCAPHSLGVVDVGVRRRGRTGGRLHDSIRHVRSNGWSPFAASLRPAPGDRPPMPAEQRRGRDHERAPPGPSVATVSVSAIGQPVAICAPYTVLLIRDVRSSSRWPQRAVAHPASTRGRGPANA